MTHPRGEHRTVESRVSFSEFRACHHISGAIILPPILNLHQHVHINPGWELGTQASAAAKTGDKGGAMQGAMSVSTGVWLYQMTDTGLAAELTAKGKKYYKDDDLN